MTTPDTPVGASPTSDAPIATVPEIGLTEVTHLLVILGSVLASTGLHRDFGLTAHAADYAPIVVAVTTLSLGFCRALKHRGAMSANASVYVAQLEHLATLIMGFNGTPTPEQQSADVATLARGMRTLNGQPAPRQASPGVIRQVSPARRNPISVPATDLLKSASTDATPASASAPTAPIATGPIATSLWHEPVLDPKPPVAAPEPADAPPSAPAPVAAEPVDAPAPASEPAPELVTEQSPHLWTPGSAEPAQAPASTPEPAPALSVAEAMRLLEAAIAANPHDAPVVNPTQRQF